MCHACNEKRKNDTLRKESNYQIKTKLERSEKRKPTNTWEFSKLKPSNKRRSKKKLRKNISEEPENYTRQNYVAET